MTARTGVAAAERAKGTPDLGDALGRDGNA